MKWLKQLLFDPDFNRKTSFLRQISFFEGVSRTEFGKLFNVLVERTYAPGEVLFKEGDIGRALFILASGQVELMRNTAHKEMKRIALLEPGDYFGEMSLFNEHPRTATATAVTTAKVYLLYKAQLNDLIQSEPRIGVAILSHLAQLLAVRLHQTIKHNDFE